MAARDTFPRFSRQAADFLHYNIIVVAAAHTCAYTAAARVGPADCCERVKSYRATGGDGGSKNGRARDCLQYIIIIMRMCCINFGDEEKGRKKLFILYMRDNKDGEESEKDTLLPITIIYTRIIVRHIVYYYYCARTAERKK